MLQVEPKDPSGVGGRWVVAWYHYLHSKGLRGTKCSLDLCRRKGECSSDSEERFRNSWKAEKCLKDVVITPFSVDLEISQEKTLAGKQANLLKKATSFQWRKAGRSTKFEKNRSDCSPAIKRWWVSSSLMLIWFGCCSFLFSLILEFQVLASPEG